MIADAIIFVTVRAAAFSYLIKQQDNERALLKTNLRDAKIDS